MLYRVTLSTSGLDSLFKIFMISIVDDVKSPPVKRSNSFALILSFILLIDSVAFIISFLRFSSSMVSDSSFTFFCCPSLFTLAICFLDLTSSPSTTYVIVLS